jgi:hypothetical protein
VCRTSRLPPGELLLHDRRPCPPPCVGELLHFLTTSEEPELRPLPAAVQVEHLENPVLVDEVENRQRLLEIDVEEPEVDLSCFTQRRIGRIRKDRTRRLLPRIARPADVGRQEDGGVGDEVVRLPDDARQRKRDPRPGGDPKLVVVVGGFVLLLLLSADRPRKLISGQSVVRNCR